MTWNSDELAKVDTKTAGRTFTVNGTVTVEGTAYDAVMNVEVLDAFGLVQEVPEGSLGSVDFDAKIKLTNPFSKDISASIVDFSLTTASSDI